MYDIVCSFEKLGLEFSDAAEVYSPNTVTQYENEYKYIRASLFSLSCSVSFRKVDEAQSWLWGSEFSILYAGPAKRRCPTKRWPKTN